MENLICMIPVRKGSQRVRGKALRKIGDTTLLEQAISLSLTFFKPEQVYLNTNWIDLKNISEKYKINFYERSEVLANSSATNDQFMQDFLMKHNCERVVQLLPTSPFVKSNEFKDFCDLALKSNDKTVVSVAPHRIASVLENGQPINFERYKQNPPSQTMQAVFTYVGVLMSWSRLSFLEKFSKNNCAYHGSEDNIYFPLSFLSQLDIDTEEDLNQAKSLTNLLPKHVS